MNRRQAIRTTLSAAAASFVLQSAWLAGQEAGTMGAPPQGDTIYLNPASGADTNSGAKESPLRTLAEAARRVNQGSGSGAMTIVLLRRNLRGR